MKIIVVLKFKLDNTNLNFNYYRKTKFPIKTIRYAYEKGKA